MTNQTNSVQQNSRVHAVVMRRVRTMYLLQSPLTTLALAGILFILAMWGIGREVWVSRVLRNMPSVTDWDAVARFYLSAFLDTRFIVQVLAVISVGAFIWLAVNVVRLAQLSRRNGQFA